jgi:transposase-like protein
MKISQKPEARSQKKRRSQKSKARSQKKDQRQSQQAAHPATKLIYLALRNIAAKWTRPPAQWQAAKAQMAIQFGSRFRITI